MWLHEPEIHLAVGAFSLGSAFGMALTAITVFFAGRRK